MFRGWELQNRLQRSSSTNADFGVAELERLRTQAQFKLGRQRGWKQHWVVPDTQVPPAGDDTESDMDPRLSCGGVASARAEVDSDHAPLASPTIASTSIVDALEPDLVATQCHPTASVSVPSGTVEFSSGDEGLVRSNVGRDVATKTVASVHPSAICCS